MTLLDSIDPLEHTEKFSRVLKQLFFFFYPSRGSGRSITLIHITAAFKYSGSIIKCFTNIRSLPMIFSSLQEDFISEEEENMLMKALDDMPWDSSQSGRRKQVRF